MDVSIEKTKFPNILLLRLNNIKYELKTNLNYLEPEKFK